MTSIASETADQPVPARRPPTTPRRLLVIVLLTLVIAAVVAPSVMPFIPRGDPWDEGPVTCLAITDAWQQEREAPPDTWGWDDDEVHETIYWNYEEWRDAGGACARGAHIRVAVTFSGLIVLAYVAWFLSHFTVSVRVERRRFEAAPRE